MSHSTLKHPAVLRFSLKTMLVVIAFVAMTCALVVQYVELAKTRASLARYETSLIPTALASDEYRVITSKLLQTDHAAIIRYRIESSEDHFATISSGDDSNGGRATYDPKTNLYVTESVLLIDHIKTKNALKVMPKVSGAQGYSVAVVADNFSLADTLTIHDPKAVYSRSDSATLVEIDDQVYTLTLKP
jgi:hypothetical protein